ncbi:glycosyltransferase family 2 protein [Aurantiacibacter sediminis]|uniref:Glycosyltransferase family 2 protein n=1 Tax=Aurantiacibacter sediminis TaxID=2793064 RepID=A0ABS0N4L8_9SPHN|nr:glycosyltransferase family 2 protein [Aurantiacibacter sediminis]MBH5322435.1 glycosyltransferase family 2 protein [Aurantiacibacter sediminis]
MKVSVLLLTYNEEINIERCLASLDWCDDIWAIDSGSTDRTLEMLKQGGVKVLHRPFDNFANQRNFGLDEADWKHDYVLHLDADEESTPVFREQIEDLSASDAVDAWNVPSKTILLGQWLKHAGMYPSYQVRLGHRERLRFVQVGHGQREDLPADRVGTLNVPYNHYNFSHGMQKWLEKHVRYARDEAEELSHAQRQDEAGLATGGRRRLKQIANKLPPALRPAFRFIYVYFVRRGFLDGKAGLAYALMMATYEGMIGSFVFEQPMNDTARISSGDTARS